jgi:hypothetical protein
MTRTRGRLDGLTAGAGVRHDDHHMDAAPPPTAGEVAPLRIANLRDTPSVATAPRCLATPSPPWIGDHRHADQGCPRAVP